MQRLLTLIALPLGLASHTHAADLHVSVHGVQVDHGQVMLALYDEVHPWLKNALHAQMIGATSRGSSTQVTLVFKNLLPGRYAVSGYHDLNGNGELDSNAMRIPTEPVGFSNSAQVRFGPPRFIDAAVTLGAEDLKINIQLK
jgi:uncharacterized protein (DUF2141 family)